jgi:para-nitrobenzyl esterase
MPFFFSLRSSLPVFALCGLVAACGGGDDDDTSSTSASPITVSGTKAVAQTTKGSVEGTVDVSSIRFQGIPFGLPPVAERRWQPPVAAASWTGTLDASKFAKHCPQQGSTLASQPNASEDCLYLNVYVPKALSTSSSSTPRAVMVWIYGGANAIGASTYYDPTPLVEAEDVVVVTMNYRVGALGFLAHPALDSEGHAAVNYGVMDQQLALKWVQENIGGFGGDKGNVTIFGESAGGLNVLTHIVSPLSAGLFHKAIVQSGAYTLSTPTLTASQARGTAFATRLGCSAQTAACLRAKTTEEILAQQGTVNTAGSAYNQSTIDGQVLTETQLAALTGGRFNRVPVMQGATSNEGRTFTAPSLSQAAYEATIGGYSAIAGRTPAEALATYSLQAYGTPAEAVAAATGDFAFACSSRRANRLLAGFVTTYAYEFADPSATGSGATHGSEISYLMKVNSSAGVGSTSGVGWDSAGDSLALSLAMRRYWAQFARAGDPNAAGVPGWQPFSTAADNVQLLVPPTPRQDAGFAGRHQCAFWG